MQHAWINYPGSTSENPGKIIWDDTIIWRQIRCQAEIVSLATAENKGSQI